MLVIGGCTQDYSALEGRSDGSVASTGAGGHAATGGHAAGTGGAAGGGGGGAAGTTGAGGAGSMIGGGGAPGAGGAAGQPGVLLGPNLITNGDFSDGSTGWLVTTPEGGSVTSSVSGGQFCASLAAGVPSVTIGWPVSPVQPLDLPTGVIYQFSFQVISTAPIPSTSFSDKIGNSVTYNADFQSTNDALAIGTQTFTHTFSLPAEDPSAGIAITFDSVTINVTVCLSSVELRQVFVSDGGML